ncbi:DUF5995 family protein [Motilibacter deserti]|uniref:Uncharacterized protein n=1 Tax=Motilibacter deserti TaxID=2714956 RepID=A0ABX0GSH9_9ACTN|nr:DUF5995 family protein [Motilibacter deserti]NHC12720.1 hypothetical protein [Motilibacter deserti]
MTDAAFDRTIDDVVTDLETVCATLTDTDGVDVFSRMYLDVTKTVRDWVRDGSFADPVFTERLDVVFAGLFLEAHVAAGPPVGSMPKPWAPLFAARHKSGIEPIQFALAGMNAHINADLPVAVIETCRLMGRSPEDDAVRADYDRINELLAEKERPIRQSFLDGPALKVDRKLSPVLDLVCNWSIEAARDAAWVQANLLWDLRRVPGLNKQALKILRGGVAMTSSMLLASID